MIVPHNFEIALVNGRRDSRRPSGPPILEVTSLASIADGLAPGRMVQLNASKPPYNTTFASFHAWTPDFILPNDISTWGACGFWDDVRKQMFMLNDRTSAPAQATQNRFNLITYLASTHEWRHLPRPSELIGLPHVYNRNAYDQSRGHFYSRIQPNRIHRFNVDFNVWEHIPVSPPTGVSLVGNSPIAYHDAMDMLITPSSNGASSRLLGWRDGDTAWRDLGLTGHDGYHAMMYYNRPRQQCMIIAGGSPSAVRRVTIIEPNGAISQKANFPSTEVDGHIISNGIANGSLSYDPVSSNFLYFQNGDRLLWEYSPTLDEFRLSRSWKSDAPNDYKDDYLPGGSWFGRAIIPIEELGVSIMYTYYLPRVYKHASVF